MTYKGIIFDLDGTLLYTLKDLSESVNYALKKCSLDTISLDKTREFVGNGIGKLIERAIGKNQDKYELCYKYFINHYSKNSTNTTKPYDGAVETLKKLKTKGIKLAILSNKKNSEVKKLSEIFFPDIFDISLGETSAFPKKPSAESVLYIIDKLNLSKKEVCIIGDSEVDIQTAKNAQIQSLSVSWGYKDKSFLLENKADKIFDNFKELFDYLISN